MVKGRFLVQVGLAAGSYLRGREQATATVGPAENASGFLEECRSCETTPSDGGAGSNKSNRISAPTSDPEDPAAASTGGKGKQEDDKKGDDSKKSDAASQEEIQDKGQSGDGPKKSEVDKLMAKIHQRDAKMDAQKVQERTAAVKKKIEGYEALVKLEGDGGVGLSSSKWAVEVSNDMKDLLERKQYDVVSKQMPQLKETFLKRFALPRDKDDKGDKDDIDKVRKACSSGIIVIDALVEKVNPYLTDPQHADLLKELKGGKGSVYEILEAKLNGDAAMKQTEKIEQKDAKMEAKRVQAGTAALEKKIEGYEALVKNEKLETESGGMRNTQWAVEVSKGMRDLLKGGRYDVVSEQMSKLKETYLKRFSLPLPASGDKEKEEVKKAWRIGIRAIDLLVKKVTDEGFLKDPHADLLKELKGGGQDCVYEILKAKEQQGGQATGDEN